MIFLDLEFRVYNLLSFLFLLTIYGEKTCIYGNERLQENEPDNASRDTAENFSSIERQTEVAGVEREDKCRTEAGMGCNTENR